MLLFVSTYIDESIIFFRVTKTNNRNNLDNDWYIRKWPHFKYCMSQSNLNFPFSNILRSVYSKFVYKINMSQVLQVGTGSKRILPCGCWSLIEQKEESEVFRTVQFSSVTQSCPTLATPWIAACQASRGSLRLTSIESVMPSSHLILSSPSPPAPNPSQHQSLFQWVKSSHEVAKGLEFQL